VKNQRVKDSWKIPDDKNFHQCFYAEDKKGNRMPKYNDKEFCLKFFALGECIRGPSCNYCHEDPRDIGLEKDFDTFFRKAYS
jgi:Torus domain